MTALSGSLLVLLAIVFVALFVIVYLMLSPLRKSVAQVSLSDRIERYGPAGSGAAVALPHETRLSQAVVTWVARAMRSSKAEPQLAARLDKAGIARHPAEWVLLTACGCLALVAVLTTLLGNILVGILLGVPIGWISMRLLLSVRIARRQAAFDEQLPNVLQLVTGSIQTGFSLSQALDAVIREETQPASAEFARALAETRLGIDLETALDGVANRMDSAELRWVVMAVRIQREVGGNLAEVLRNTVGTMRERAYLRRQVRALSAEGRLSAYILVALPIVVGAWLVFSSPTYMHPLFSTAIGLIMLAGAAVLMIIGALWMRVLINVKA